MHHNLLRNRALHPSHHCFDEALITEDVKVTDARLGRVLGVMSGLLRMNYVNPPVTLSVAAASLDHWEASRDDATGFQATG